MSFKRRVFISFQNPDLLDERRLTVHHDVYVTDPGNQSHTEIGLSRRCSFRRGAQPLG